MYFYYPTKDDNHVAELTRVEIERHFRTSCELIIDFVFGYYVTDFCMWYLGDYITELCIR